MNFLERLLKRRQDPTVHWGSLKPPLPDFDWSAMRFGPLGFGSDINEAAFLGRADRIDWVDTDYFILLYAPEGFQIEFEHESWLTWGSS